MKKIIALLIIVVAYFADLSAIFASEIPVFPYCINPQGTIKASYDNGIHGIAGKTGTYEGKDVVYTLSENSLLQCFCPADGKGIQTNWFKATGLSENEIAVLKSEGWIYIPNGALWGLDSAPYIAKNLDFSCPASGGGGSSNGGSNSNSNSGSGGSVLGSAVGGVGQVLGLASTGNNIFLLGTSIVSGISLITGLFLKKRSKKLSK